MTTGQIYTLARTESELFSHIKSHNITLLCTCNETTVNPFTADLVKALHFTILV